MIDWTKAEELRQDIGDADFQEIIDVFLLEVEDALAALPGRSESELPGALHFIKGSALNLGFVTLAELCSEGERSIEEGKPDTLNRDDIANAFFNSKAEFTSRYIN